MTYLVEDFYFIFEENQVNYLFHDKQNSMIVQSNYFDSCLNALSVDRVICLMWYDFTYLHFAFTISPGMKVNLFLVAANKRSIYSVAKIPTESICQKCGTNGLLT